MKICISTAKILRFFWVYNYFFINYFSIDIFLYDTPKNNERSHNPTGRWFLGAYQYRSTDGWGFCKCSAGSSLVVYRARWWYGLVREAPVWWYDRYGVHPCSVCLVGALAQSKQKGRNHLFAYLKLKARQSHESK